MGATNLENWRGLTTGFDSYILRNKRRVSEN